MLTYYTTSTAPGFLWTFADPSGNIPPDFASAAFVVMFRSLTTLQKVEGAGDWGTPNGTTGQVTYTLGINDMANAYKLASPAMLIGEAIFEIMPNCIIDGQRYDAAPSRIKIRKI
jgi:hypothetical protein